MLIDDTGIIADVVSQHAEEAAHLWMLRDSAVASPGCSLPSLMRLDERLQAHLDGLRFARDAGWRICQNFLEAHPDPGELFVAAVLALQSRSEARVQIVFDHIKVATPLARSMISAFGWLSSEEASNGFNLLQALGSSSPSLPRVLLAAFAIRRHDPGELLPSALAIANEPKLTARALKAVGELGRRDLLPAVHEWLSSDEPECRFWAAWSAALLGEGSAVPVLKSFSYSESSRRELATSLALRLMNGREGEAWREELAKDAASRRLAVIGSGAIGDPASVPWIILQMEDPEMARVAGEAFTTITGLQLINRYGGAHGSTLDDENNLMDSDEHPDNDSPWPAPEMVAEWWRQHAVYFAVGSRYLKGQPICEQSLRTVLREGNQRQRAAASLELALLFPGEPLFETRAPAFRQEALLGGDQQNSSERS